ncbi:hypothetical protein ACHAO9_007149 [Fusarium lateritium]
MSCPQCFTGHVNPGTPTGRWSTVHGLRTYTAQPSGGKNPTGIVVIIPDAFGVDFVNNQILADHYASAANYQVFLPDFMNETALPVGVAGFCWGGLHTIRLTHDTAETQLVGGRPLADAFFTAHPSNLDVVQDIGNVRRNLSIAIGDDDGVMGMKQVRQAESILASIDVEMDVVIYPGAKHGFSIRASRAEPDSKETRQAEEAEEQAITWFKRQFDIVKQRAAT